MASIRVKFRPSAADSSQGSICYQITHQRRVRHIATHHRLAAAQWNPHRQTVSLSPDLTPLRQAIDCDLRRLDRIQHHLESRPSGYTADDIVAGYIHYSREYTLFRYMETLIESLSNHGHDRTSETYRSTLNSFRKFRHDEDIMLDCITADTMESYEAWHRRRGITPNTISFYTRILRAVYNRAVEADIIDNCQPFRHVYTGVDKTVKRAIPLDAIRRIKCLDLQNAPSLDFARDMFMLSFYLRGMSFIDMAFLRKTDLRNGYVFYRRRKTGQQLIIAWTREMQQILDKYPENSSPYLLPVIKTTGLNERSIYRNTGYNINHNLKKIAQLADAPLPLTLYVARHSWASAARAKGIPLSIISEGMGHDSEATTRIYLASLDTAAVDQANARILRSLR